MKTLVLLTLLIWPGFMLRTSAQDRLTRVGATVGDPGGSRSDTATIRRMVMQQSMKAPAAVDRTG